MIDALKALGWLNAIDHSSRLSNDVRLLLRGVQRFPLDDVRVSLILERLRSIARASGEPLEKAEILLCCASIGCYRPAWSPPAARDAREAITLYDRDDHRRAVALWILGSIQWEMHHNQEAYKNCSHAKELFRQRQILFKNLRAEKEWYGHRMWEMDVELVARPEEIASWLNHFEGSSLRSQTQRIVHHVREKTRRQAYPNVYALMQDLQEANRCSEGFYETAEIHLEFGLAVYQLRNPHAAIDFLRKAVRNFYPGFDNYHKQIVARCMLGAVEWMLDATQKQAAADWIQCLNGFENLRWCADRDHCQDKEEWYTHRCDTLRAALLERVRPPDGSEPESSRPEQTVPRSPSSPSPGKTVPYQQLLAKVGWDRGIADRLIEYERKKAPAADRNELIRRAIERWICDDQ